MPPYVYACVVIDDENRSFLPRLKGKHVRRLHVTVRRRSEAEHIANCVEVEDLELWSWKDADFTALSSLAVRRLRLVRGRQTSLHGLNLSCLRRLEVLQCRHLVNLNGLCIPALEVAFCNSFDIDSLSTIQGLLSLRVSHKRMESFDFVTGCRSLGVLEVGTDKPYPRDFGPIIESPTLELFFCNWLKDAEMEKISTENPRLLVARHNMEMLGGVRVSECFWQRYRAFHKQNEIEITTYFGK